MDDAFSSNPNPNPRHPQRERLKKQMLAGAIAGTLADGIMYPMQTVKSRLMVQGGAAAAAAAAAGTATASCSYMYRGPLHALHCISSQEGWKALFKGYATIVKVSVSQALYIGIYQTSKAVVPGGENNAVVQFGGGILATLVQSLINVPVDIIRQRQMVQHTASDGAYKTSVDAVRTIYRQEGVASLYRGFFFAQMVWGPYNAIYLPLWEASKRFCARRSGAASVDDLSLHYELASAFLSASVAAAVTNPMDVVKTRIQVQGKSNNVFCSSSSSTTTTTTSTAHYSGALNAAAAIWKHEGAKGFASGIVSRIFWVAPSGMIMFTAYDQILKRL